MQKPKIKPGNYCKKVLEQFTKTFNEPQVFLEGLDKSAKFLLPVDGDVGIKLDPQEIAERLNNIFRLPFPETALEYSFDMEYKGENRRHKALVLCLEGFRAGDDIYLEGDSINGFLISFFHIHNDCLRWALAPTSNWISTEENSLMASLPVESANGYGHDLLAEEVQDYFKEIFDKGTEVVFNFIVASQLKNVKYVSLPADIRLNKGGGKVKDFPFYDYLVLDTCIDALEKQRSFSSKGGDKEPSRAHVVKGHIKSRNSGHYWWNAHLRGDQAKGFIKKDYRFINKRDLN